jgi:SAM-dependent methyltransferase
VSVFDAPLGYELAFSYRDVPAEVDALLAWHGGAVRTSLELAAGPGDHALELARRGIAAATLDLSPAMCARVAERAAAEGLTLTRVVRADMTAFAVEGTFDLVFCLIDSLAHVLTLESLIGHLESVRRALAPGGTYVIESLHPADGFQPGSRTDTEWTTERDGISAHIRWGRGDEPIDPLTQVTHLLVTLDVAGPDGTAHHEELMAQRFWTIDELTAAARIAGLVITERYGDFVGNPLDHPQAWRLISVLRTA